MLTACTLVVQVFIPREDLSLDVIKQYRVVRAATASFCHVQDFSTCVVLHAPFLEQRCLSCYICQECPNPVEKIVVLKDMIFPQCEKLGQTIIFVRTREVARALHTAVRCWDPHIVVGPLSSDSCADRCTR